MAKSKVQNVRKIGDDVTEWFQERNKQVGILKSELEHAGREFWNAGTRAGIDVVARTPQELQALGARIRESVERGAIQNRLDGKPVYGSVNSNASPKARYPASATALGQGLREAALQADTAVRSAANTLTFGGADHLAAGLDAVLQPEGFEDRQGRYATNLAGELARNRYDASNRRWAQGIGQIGGATLGLGVVGPLEGALAAAPRLAGAAAVTNREIAAILGAGAGMGLVTQTVSDALAGGRKASLGDNLGAALGGAAGSAALPLGPARAGAVEASVTSAAQDVFNGQPISLSKMGENAIAGNILGGVAGIVGRVGSNALPTVSKGLLGDGIGEIRSRVNLEARDWVPKTSERLSKGYWYPDGRSGAIRFEDKFGVGATLSPGQKLAQLELGSDFRLYHTLPADIGKVFGLPAATVAPLLLNERPRR